MRAKTAIICRQDLLPMGEKKRTNYYSKCSKISGYKINSKGNKK